MSGHVVDAELCTAEIDRITLVEWGYIRDACVGSRAEHFLKGLSNRDYERFDEKYIKVVMLSLLSNVNLYIPHSEYEVSADGYVDLYLQAAFEPERSAHYFIELKYAKAKAPKKTLDKKEDEGIVEMRTYLQSETAKTAKNLQAYVLVFRKDTCVRTIRCAPNST